MADDPTPRELLIQMQGLVKQVEALALRVDSTINTLTTTYVPKGEYLSDRRGDDRRFGEIESDLASQAGFRRQVIAALLTGFILLVAGIVLTLAQNGAGVASP